MKRVWAIDLNRHYLKWLFALLVLAIVDLTGCATTSHYQFAAPARDWQTLSGQLMYRTPKTTLIGEVLVRFSKRGDLQLTFSKGGGVTMIMVQQDVHFARVEGPLARGRWSGPTENAPPRLRSWLALRNLLTQTKKTTVKQTTGDETFLFEF
jgi:hypothetical protein